MIALAFAAVLAAFLIGSVRASRRPIPLACMTCDLKTLDVHEFCSHDCNRPVDPAIAELYR